MDDFDILHGRKLRVRAEAITAEEFREQRAAPGANHPLEWAYVILVGVRKKLPADEAIQESVGAWLSMYPTWLEELRLQSRTSTPDTANNEC